MLTLFDDFHRHLKILYTSVQLPLPAFKNYPTTFKNHTRHFSVIK